MKRRDFLHTSAISAAAMAVPGILSASLPSGEKRKHLTLKKGSTILFQGDSITDAGRDKSRETSNNSGAFGGGYALMAASALLRKYSSLGPVIYNRGISGNKVFQLAGRWEKDCISLNPDVLSILIGVNDYWHMRNGSYDGTAEKYENDLRKLLQDTKVMLPGIQLVVCQPFVLPGTSAVDDSWIAPFSVYQDAAYRVCNESDAIWVPFQRVFDEALKQAPASWWAPDGVHPSMAGAFLMASAWLKATTGTDM